ncbi:unnamed protein product [Effrenium voratum]|nr:unnamed protein product [Effrenium voratum]
MRGHRPAVCAGVVAPGYSLALPESGAGNDSHDPQSKRWRAAQQGFYADARSLERDLSSIKACALTVDCAELAGTKKGRSHDCCTMGRNIADTLRRERERERAKEESDVDESVLGFVDVCHVKRFPQRPAQLASFETLAGVRGRITREVDNNGAALLSNAAQAALRHMNIDEPFQHQHTALRLG